MKHSILVTLVIVSLFAFVSPDITHATPFITKRKVYIYQGKVWKREWPSKSAVQLTTHGNCSEPVISPDGKTVAFIRNTDAYRIYPSRDIHFSSELWTVKCNGTGSKRLYRTSLKSNPGASDRRDWLGVIGNPRFSAEGKYVYALVWTHIVSSSILCVNIDGSYPHVIGSGNSLEVVPVGKYKGCLIANQHLYYKESGSIDIDTLCSPDGRVMFLLQKPAGELSQVWPLNLKTAQYLKALMQKHQVDTWQIPQKHTPSGKLRKSVTQLR